MRFAVPRRVGHVLVEGAEQPDVGSVEDPELYLMRLPDGPPVRLTGTAATIWLVASDGVEDVVDRIAKVVERKPGEIERDVAAYLDLLVTDGLLEGVLS